MGRLRERRDVVLIDYRGTGLSDAIDCESLQNGSLDDLYANVAECGGQLGSRSDLYGSDDVAADIEAVRAALGLRRFDYFGFSTRRGRPGLRGAPSAPLALGCPRRAVRVPALRPRRPRRRVPWRRSSIAYAALGSLPA